MLYCCIHVTLYVLDVSPLLCNVDVMISTLQKRLQDALLSLVGPSSSFRIGSHLGRDNKCLDRTSGRIYISRDVVFDETVFSYSNPGVSVDIASLEHALTFPSNEPVSD